MGSTKQNYAEFYDPRLVAVYNTVCPLDGYEQFYLKLAEELSATTIIDIGCGTGLLTCELAKHGYYMIGIEPAKLMLDAARKSPCSSQVTWLEGDALSLGEHNADLALMTGHVAQFHLDDEYWLEALTCIYRALRPGGHLAFESRNTAVQPWVNHQEHRDWHAAASPLKVTDPIEGSLEVWSEPVRINGERVTFKGHYLFERTGEELISMGELIFRTKQALTLSVEAAGFFVDTVYGFWDWSLATSESPEFIIIAQRG
jgi:SAM-dependent methyltransferase